ncbi:MAG: HEAT repeat domain-containing protein [Candidatus Omnitrophica bacterium]|nr:HEAT repeat domain-containing protein [Candidatus Omnitrophota bacterium]
MTKRRRLIITGAVLALVLVLAELLAHFLGPGEPVYQGKQLSDWLQDLCHGQSAQLRDQAKNAIRQIGTNAIPTLLDMVRARDSRLKLKFMQWTSRQSMVRFRFQPAMVLHTEAVTAFSVLGPAAIPAIEPLAEILGHSETAFTAANALAQLGSNSVPILVQALTNDDWRVRYAAATAFTSEVPDEQTVVPALVASLKDGNPNVRIMAARSLANIGQDPDRVVPALMANLDDPIPDVRASTARALGRFGSLGAPAVPILSKMSRDANPAVRNAATEVLRKIESKEGVSAEGAGTGRRQGLSPRP